tara:strand:- start:229 stop:339 length:111 start_codon:yes stop_codon:yes gene_type:complete
MIGHGPKDQRVKRKDQKYWTTFINDMAKEKDDDGNY